MLKRFDRSGTVFPYTFKRVQNLNFIDFPIFPFHLFLERDISRKSPQDSVRASPFNLLSASSFSFCDLYPSDLGCRIRNIVGISNSTLSRMSPRGFLFWRQRNANTRPSSSSNRIIYCVYYVYKEFAISQA